MSTSATANNVASFFDSYASDFNAIYGNRNTFFNRVVNKHLRRSMRVRFEKTIDGCMPVKGKTVVDIGTGPGHYAIALAREGAKEVLGLDFAEGMVEIARRNAAEIGVSDNCRFEFGDFLTREFNKRYDFAILMGFMDYIENPRPTIEKALSITAEKAFFSFPVAEGFLAWQRRVRYRSRCDLFLYTREQLNALFNGTEAKGVRIDRIARDYFVTASMKGE